MQKEEMLNVLVMKVTRNLKVFRRAKLC
jgi:hypothetical protein